MIAGGYGNIREYGEIYGHIWKYMGIYGNMVKYIEIYTEIITYGNMVKSTEIRLALICTLIISNYLTRSYWACSINHKPTIMRAGKILVGSRMRTSPYPADRSIPEAFQNHLAMGQKSWVKLPGLKTLKFCVHLWRFILLMIFTWY